MRVLYALYMTSSASSCDSRAVANAVARRRRSGVVAVSSCVTKACCARRIVSIFVLSLLAGVPATMLRELSMGMSGDFEVAIQEGATMVRVGTAIFGSRHVED